MTCKLTRIAWSCLLALVLAVGVLAVTHPEKAYADTTITELNVNVDFSKVTLDASKTGKEVNQLFRDNRSLDETTGTMVRVDSDYSFLAEKKGVSSKGMIQRKRLNESEELLTATVEKAEDGNVGDPREYYLVFNLIQRAGYTFPEGEANMPLSVTVNGASYSGIQVDRYNNDSVDVYVPIPFDNKEVLTSVKIVTEANSDYIQAGKYVNLSYKEVGHTISGYTWTVEGNTQSGTKIGYGNKLIVDAAEPSGTVLTITVTSKAFPGISDSIALTVINGAPTVEKVNVTAKESAGVTPEGNNATVDVTNGTKTIDFDVEVKGTASKSFTVDFFGAHSKSTKLSRVDENGFQITVNSNEPTGALRAIVRSSYDSNKSALVTISVLGVPRVNYIDLIVDTSKIYFNPLATQTGSSLKPYFSKDYIMSTGLDTYVDFSNDGQYSYLAKKGVNGSGEIVYTKVAADETLTSDEEYFLALNIENCESGSSSSLWPDDKESIRVYANGRAVGKDGYGVLDWYCHSDSGSLLVLIPLEGKGTTEYGVTDFAPGIKAVYYKGSAPSRAFDRYTVMSYKGNVMYYAEDTACYYYLVEGEVTDPVRSDFGSVQMESQEYYPYQVSKPGFVKWDVPGDVNRSGKLNAVDAQVAYDIAKGGAFTLDSLPAKCWIACDVDGNNHVDETDADIIWAAALAESGSASYPAPESSEYTVSLQSEKDQVTTGSDLNVTLTAATANSAYPLSSGQFAISFDPAVVSLAASDVAINSALANADATIGPGMLLISFYGNTLEELPVAALNFKTLGEGNPQIAINGVVVGATGSLAEYAAAYSTEPLNVSVVDPVIPAPTRLAAGKTIAKGNLTYTVLSGKMTVSVKVNASKRRSITSLSIPSTVKDANGFSYKVTTVAASGFKGCTKLTKVTNASYSNLTKINADAFRGCTKLSTVNITSKKLKTVSARAFYGCSSLKTTVMSSPVLTTIGSSAFYKTKNMTVVNIGKTTALKTVTGAFKSAGKDSGRSLSVKVKSTKLKTYKKLILNKGGNKKLTVKKA